MGRALGIDIAWHPHPWAVHGTARCPGKAILHGTRIHGPCPALPGVLVAADAGAKQTPKQAPRFFRAPTQSLPRSAFQVYWLLLALVQDNPKNKHPGSILSYDYTTTTSYTPGTLLKRLMYLRVCCVGRRGWEGDMPLIPSPLLREWKGSCLNFYPYNPAS